VLIPGLISVYHDEVMEVSDPEHMQRRPSNWVVEYGRGFLGHTRSQSKMLKQTRCQSMAGMVLTCC
jgi:hypothetical protein